MKVFLTGASGYLGGHILEELEKHSIEYIALSRKKQSRPHFTVGDLLKPESFSEALSSCDMVIHAAGEVAHDEDAAEYMWNVHVQGTRSLINAIKQANTIKRVVFLSTSGTIAVSDRSDYLGHEESPDPFFLIKTWPYYRAKYFSEQVIFDELPKDIELVTLNPSLLLGPGDKKGEALKPIRLFLDGQLPLAPSGGLSFADVRDVARTAVDALTQGSDRKRYLLSGCNLTFLEFYQKIARISGKKAPLSRLPKQTRQVLSWFPKWKNIGETMGLDLQRADIILASHYWYADASLATAELKWTASDPIRTLEDSVHELQKESFMDFIG